IVVVVLPIVALLIAVAPPCFASLGGDAVSVATDQAQLHGSLQTRQMQSFAVHEIRPQTGTADSTVIREYVSPAGKVFAVTWEGPMLPNMRQLLGPYFQQFADAVQSEASSSRARRPLNIVRPDFVVQLSGRSRSFSGRAYLPQMLPAGVQPGDIQ
ncbi:MAG: DUF2844 domain-containing protein, partial [Candidatus Sulfotelmatobacter sp.]